MQVWSARSPSNPLITMPSVAAISNFALNRTWWMLCQPGPSHTLRSPQPQEEQQL